MDEVEEIKRRLDIVDFISTYLTLKKAGSNYKALCPFHQEKTPSFMVSPEKQIWKCFGCGEGGDIFSFVMKMENLEFPEALRMLADRAGVKLENRKSKIEIGQKDRKTRLYQINNLSAKVFHKILLDHPAGKMALEYLKKRGIANQTIKDFMIGYAPVFANLPAGKAGATAGKPSYLTKFLIQRGFTENEIQEAGAPNRFFRRIMFPIRDAMGNTIAFTGRAIEEGQESAYAKASADRPKYLNTPDTILFHKGRVLYNLNQARGPIKQENAAIVVEGQMDVVASHQAGVKNVVASSGTALTNEHLQILYRYTPNIIFAFDSDTAGLKTAKKAYEMAIIEGFNVKMVVLNEFKDPGEMIAANPPAGGPQLWHKAVKEPKAVIDWYFELAFNEKLNNRSTEQLTSQQKKEIAKEILPIIKIIPDQIEQAHYVNLLAKRLGVNEEVVFAALLRVGQDKPSKPKPIKARENLTIEELILAIFLYNPEKIKEASSKVAEKDFKNPKNFHLYKLLLEEYNLGEKELIKRLKSKTSREEQVLVDNLIMEAEKLYQADPASLEADFSQALAHLKTDKREALKNYYASEIKKAEVRKDHGRLKQLIKEFQEAISK